MADISIENNGAVHIVRLQRAAKKNALTVAMYQLLSDALSAAEKDDSVHAVLLTGSEGVFSAGNDILDFLQNPPSGEDSAVFAFLRALALFKKPLIAAVDGPAVGIGTTLLLHCDRVVASSRARFHLPFVRLGLVPEAASTLLLPAVAGLQRASEWLLWGEPFSAEDAYRAGLLSCVVPPEELEAKALSFAQAVALLPPQAVQNTKRLLRAPLQNAVQETMVREKVVFLERLASEEAQQAFAAFMARK